MMFLLWIFLIYIAVSVIWTFVERLIYGKEKPKFLHDVIAIILAVSLYMNFS